MARTKKAKPLGQREMFEKAHSSIAKNVRYYLDDPQYRWEASYKKVNGAVGEFEFKPYGTKPRQGALKGKVRIRLNYGTYGDEYGDVEAVWSNIIKIAVKVLIDKKWVLVKELSFMYEVDNGSRILEHLGYDDSISEDEVFRYFESRLKHGDYIGDHVKI